MAVSLTYATTVTSVETLDTGVPAISTADNTVTHTGYNSSASLTAATTPPVTKCAYFLQALAGGAATIDLTALPATYGTTVNGTGLKVQALKIKASAGNANPWSATFGAANPYNLAGADWKVTLTAGQEFCFYGNDATPDVAAGAKNIDCAGTGVQTAEITVVLG